MVPMRIVVVLLGFLTLLGLAPLAAAQDQAWLQVEAQPTLRAAEDRARAYASLFPGVAGFQTNSGWYAVVLGPYAPEAAAAKIVELRQAGMIPADSFVSDGSVHRQQFWPVGAETLTPLPEPEVITEVPLADQPAAEVPDIEAVAEPVAEPVIVGEPEETVKQARQSEAGLTRGQREDLQTALKWYGFYAAAIDGAFGPGTRKSMAAWQEANGYEPSGILTSRQRASLTRTYRADQAEFGFETITEAEAGIEITLPMALVAFDHYELPFAHFAEKNGSGLRVILISQPGEQSSLYGLYDILQTLEIVPPAGERERGETSFTINAASDTVQSFAYAAVAKGQVKGFLVTWNPADADRMSRILPVLEASFRAVGDKALDPGLVPMDDAARRGLLSGLEVRKPLFSRSGFFIDAAGSVLTTAEAVARCGRITIDRETDVTVTLTDAATGVAVLTPLTRLSPPAVAAFQTGAGRIGAEITVAGYSFEDTLPAPVLTFGVLEDIAGLDGAAGLKRLSAPVLAGDAGGPVLDGAGTVLGMLLPTDPKAARKLPEGVAFAAAGSALAPLLAGAGIVLTRSDATGQLTPDALTAQAMGMTVLVSCWE